MKTESSSPMTKREHDTRLLGELLARVEAAEGADRELDADLAVAFDLRPDWLAFADGELWVDLGAGLSEPVIRFRDAHMKRSPGDPAAGPYPRLTASLDATLALCERVLPGCWYILGKGKLNETEPLYGAQLLFGSGEVLGAGEHEASQALALLAALLRALITQAQPSQTGESGEGKGEGR